MTTYRLSPEMQLLGVLCRWSLPHRPEKQTHIPELCQRVSDWEYFLGLVAHHRVTPHALKGATLTTCPLPDSAFARLRADTSTNAREAFLYLAEVQRLLAKLALEGIPVVVLKGVPLSYLAFGDVAMREVGDIDLLIDPASAVRADTLFRKEGFVRKEPGAPLTPKRTKVYAKYFKDYTYEPGNRFEVDLHWRLVRDTQLADALLPQTAIEIAPTLQIGSITMQVLSLEQCILYLAAHGAIEGWAQWKSLVDVAGLWIGANGAERESVWRLAEENGIAGYLSSGLQLAAEWLGTLPDRDFEVNSTQKEFSQNRTHKYILRSTHRRMIESSFMPPPAREKTFRMKLHEARLHSSMRSRLELAVRILFRPRMWQTFDLPDRLFFLYPWMSLLEWFVFRIRRLARNDEMR